MSREVWGCPSSLEVASVLMCKCTFCDGDYCVCNVYGSDVHVLSLRNITYVSSGSRNVWSGTAMYIKLYQSWICSEVQESVSGQ